MFSDPDRHLPHHHLAAVIIGAVALATTAGLLAARAGYGSEPSASFSEAGFDEDDASPYSQDPRIAALASWTRPPGPPRVGIQAGHWLAEDAPDELENIRANGAYAAGYAEWKTNLDIARRTAAILEKEGVIADVIPATVPAGYVADAFVSVHADDNPDTRVSGYKVASPRRDWSGRSGWLETLLAEEYETATGMVADPNVTGNMRGYYAFNWRRYEHAIHPMTPATILETGFLSSPRDRKIIVQSPDIAAEAIARALLRFLGIPESQE